MWSHEVNDHVMILVQVRQLLYSTWFWQVLNVANFESFALIFKTKFQLISHSHGEFMNLFIEILNQLFEEIYTCEN